MDLHFPEWYGIVKIAAAHETLSRRWAAVEKLSASSKQPELCTFSRLFHRLPVQTSGVFDQLRDAIREGDPSFPVDGHDEELALLSGAILSHISEGQSHLKDFATLALVVPGFLGRSANSACPSIGELARQQLQKRCRSLRKPLPVGDSPAQTIAVDEQLDALSEQLTASQFPQAAATLDALMKSLIVACNQLTADSRAYSTARQLDQEESDIWWWLYSRHSRDLEVPFDQVPSAGRSLVIGKEFSDLVRVVPGPAAAKALMQRHLTDNGAPHGDEISIAEAVGSISREWRQSVVSSNDFTNDPLLPLSFAIGASLSVDKEKDWHPIFKKALGVPATKRVSHADLAFQFYLERLLTKSSHVLV
jgi:hypothetical protein